MANAENKNCFTLNQNYSTQQAQNAMSAPQQQEFDASLEVEKIINKFNQLPKEDENKLKKPLTDVLINGLNKFRLQMPAEVDLEDLLNFHMSSVLPNAAVKKIRKANNIGKRFYEFCEALTKSSVYALIRFLISLKSTHQEHLYCFLCTEEFCNSLMSFLDKSCQYPHQQIRNLQQNQEDKDVEFGGTSNASLSDDTNIGDVLQNAQQSLKKIYLTKFQKVYPFSLPFTFNVENTCISLALNDDTNVSRATEDHAELLKRIFEKANMLIIEGNPATGKTCLMRRLAYDWANGKQELLHYNLVLYAEFREVREKVFKKIVNLVLGGLENYLDGKDIKVLGLLLNDKQFCRKNHILVLLDGYDESSLIAQCSDLSSYLTEKTIRKPLFFNTVITTRKGYLSNLKEREGRFVIAEVLGFTTKEQKDKYIHTHFLSSEINNKHNIAAVHSLLCNNENLNKLAEIPLFLTFICLVHERIVDGTLVELYCNIVWWLIDRHQQDFPDRDIPALLGFKNSSRDKFETIQHHFLHFPQLHWLGNMALRNLKENVFKTSDCTQFNLQPIIEQVGLLRKERKHGNSFKLASSFHFPHRSIQEFFAAFYCFCSNDRTNKWLLPNSILDTSLRMKEFERFLLRIALCNKMPIEIEKRKYYFERIVNIQLDTTFDAFNTIAGFNKELLNWFLSQCANVQSITLNCNLNSARQARNTLNDSSKHDESDIPSKMSNPTPISLNNLMKLHSLAFKECPFEDFSQLSIINCPSLRNLQYGDCKVKSSKNPGIATLPAIDNVEFEKCTFKANSKLSFANCPTLKSLRFTVCKMKSSLNLNIATLSAIDTMGFYKCSFRANSQLSITYCPSLKHLKLTECKMRSRTFLGIAMLSTIDTVELISCTFEANSKMSILNCSSLKNLKFTECKMKSNTNLDIATLPAIDIVEFVQCTFEDYSKLSITNCSSMKTLKFTECEMKSTINLSIAILPTIETVDFVQCIFEINSKLLITSCPSLINLKFEQCEMKRSTKLDIATLPTIETLSFEKCTFETNCQLSITSCPSLKNLKFEECQMNSTNLNIATLPGIKAISFEKCTFEINSQLSITNCLSLKNLRFAKSKMTSSTILGFVTLLALDAVTIYRCKIDLAAWLSIIDAILNSSVKCLKLTFAAGFNRTFFTHLQNNGYVEKMVITIQNHEIHQNDLFAIRDLMKLHPLTFERCTFKANSQLSIANCPALKNLMFNFCKIESNTNLSIATLPAIDTMGFYECTFEASSQLSIKNCSSLKNLNFFNCEIKSSIILGIAAWSTIDTVRFQRCKIDLSTWRSITDAIRNSSVKNLKLSADYFVKDISPEFSHYLQKCERIEEIHILYVDSVLSRNEEEVTANLAQIALKLPKLRCIIIVLDADGRRLKERNIEQIENVGRERNSEFSIKYM